MIDSFLPKGEGPPTWRFVVNLDGIKHLSLKSGDERLEDRIPPQPPPPEMKAADNLDKTEPYISDIR